MNRFLIKRAETAPAPDADYFSKDWSNAESIELKDTYGKDFVPEVSLKMLYDDNYIYGRFFVKDQYVIVKTTACQQQVCFDSCVEIFIQPQNNLRYYNFEFSGGGNMLLYNITDLRNKKYEEIPVAELDSVIRKSTLPAKIDPEWTEPTEWQFFFAIPIDFFVKYGDNVCKNLKGQTWRANVTKCADSSSHPHWTSWSKLPKVDFHLPEIFGELVFE